MWASTRVNIYILNQVSLDLKFSSFFFKLVMFDIVWICNLHSFYIFFNCVKMGYNLLLISTLFFFIFSHSCVIGTAGVLQGLKRARWLFTWRSFLLSLSAWHHSFFLNGVGDRNISRTARLCADWGLWKWFWSLNYSTCDTKVSWKDSCKLCVCLFFVI